MLMAPLGYDKSLQRTRGTVVIESGTVTTVSTITNAVPVGNVASLDVEWEFATPAPALKNLVLSQISKKVVSPSPVKKLSNSVSVAQKKI
jgi:hypothetical protein